MSFASFNTEEGTIEYEMGCYLSLFKLLQNSKKFSSYTIKDKYIIELFSKVSVKTLEILKNVKLKHQNKYIKELRIMIENNNIDTFNVYSNIENFNNDEKHMLKEQIFQIYIELILRKGIGHESYSKIFKELRKMKYSRFNEETKDIFDQGEHKISDLEFKENHYYMFGPDAPIILISKIELGLNRYIFQYCDDLGKPLTPMLISSILGKTYSAHEIPKLLFLSAKLDLI